MKGYINQDELVSPPIILVICPKTASQGKNFAPNVTLQTVQATFQKLTGNVQISETMTVLLTRDVFPINLQC